MLIGTGNVGKYHIKFQKRIRIASNDIEVSYFKYDPKFEDAWKILSKEKLIFREIAKELTWVYDPGVFVNITGLYFVSIPSLDTNELFCLMSILNSRLMNEVFSTLFGTLHMSGGYLRFNGSFIKRLPMPGKYPSSLSLLSKIIQFLSQIRYDLSSEGSSSLMEGNERKNIEACLNSFKELNDLLVHVLFTNEVPEKSVYTVEFLKEILFSKDFFPEINFKFFKPRFALKKFETIQIDDLRNELDKIFRVFYKLKL